MEEAVRDFYSLRPYSMLSPAVSQASRCHSNHGGGVSSEASDIKMYLNKQVLSFPHTRCHGCDSDSSSEKFGCCKGGAKFPASGPEEELIFLHKVNR